MRTPPEKLHWFRRHGVVIDEPDMTLVACFLNEPPASLPIVLQPAPVGPLAWVEELRGGLATAARLAKLMGVETLYAARAPHGGRRRLVRFDVDKLARGA